MRKIIENGIYLIIDPSMDRNKLINRLQLIVQENIAALQIWDNFKPDEYLKEFIDEIIELCHPKRIPVLINNRWELLKACDLDGIHFDEIPTDIDVIRSSLGKNVITGITCNNDLTIVKWANENEMDYISFCSMFPSNTASSCEIVTFKTVKEARKISHLPLFLAGGITPENMNKLDELNYSGIAVVSGIMTVKNPVEALKIYNTNFTTKKI